MQSKTFLTNKTLNLRGRLLDLSMPRVMGILNVTPDSFYSGSRLTSEVHVLKQAEKMLAEGASFLDVGGYSTRPGANEVSVNEEIDRIRKAIKSIGKEFPEALISIDSFRSEVVRVAVGEGAVIINDVSGGSLDPHMFETVATLHVPYVLMHMQGNPQTMASLTNYTHLIKEIIDYFHKKLQILHALGVKDILVDPGFGFAKTVDQNFEILQQLPHFHLLEKPIMVGLSRKSMVWKTIGLEAEQALNGTTVLNTIALLKGASLLRVHDVREAVEVCKLVSKSNETSYSHP